jgi:hypothetical protein
VIDYPVASQPTGYEPLQAAAADGRAIIGAHLHPWVNPPHEEEPSALLSYPGNLPPDLEARKLRTLADAIEWTFGRRPTLYKAGRYGLGPHTGALLEREGFLCDLSVCPGADLGGDGGPDFTRFPPEPYWFGDTRRLLEIPITAGFVGLLHRLGPSCHAALRGPLAWTRLPAVASRLRLLDRLRLSPEGVGFEDHARVTRALFARGVRTFTYSFHSPSLKPGCTPYVRDDADLAAFLASCRRYFEFFLGPFGGVASTPDEVFALAEAEDPA